MKDKNDEKTIDMLRSPGARRQAAYRARQRAAGRRQRVVWINEQDWQAGHDAGLQGLPSWPVPPGVDGLSWVSGYIEGAAKREEGA